MNPRAHIGYVPALQDFQKELATFGRRAAGALKATDDAARTVEHQLAHECSLAADHVRVWQDRHAQAVSAWNSCCCRHGSQKADAMCGSERAQVEEAAAGVVREEARLAALKAAYVRLAAVVDVFRVERACLDKVVDVDLTQADQTLTLKLMSIEAYLGQAHRR